MNAEDEQREELEVLQSIYPDELKVLSDTHFQIRIKLDTPSTREHTLLLDVRYPAEYPEVIPQLDVEIAEDLPDEEDDEDYDDDDDYESNYADYDDSSDDEDTKAAKKALNMSETVEFSKSDLKKLHDKLIEEATVQIGIPMVFALATQLKDDAEQLWKESLDRMQAEYDRQLLEREAQEQKKFNGTPVTVESFSAWRSKFREEMKFEEQLKQKFDAMHQGKLTGREIFEKGLAKEADDEESALTEAVKKVAI
ncbi:RWD domain-containing protein [Scheffersomyces xylosifermentans]|uniref:RWD domain-containing protein n=1 Tax=Scheffersomyces xylosifermentans TaxID=1304137 RepID=UPI00315C7ED7